MDIGATEVYVSVSADRDSQPVQCFDTFTGELVRLAEWLKQCRIKTVAMEATGVYWIPVYQLRESRGFEVCLVNARYFQNVPGRKTDVSDCQWLQRLHSAGLLRASFRPAQEVCELRSLTRHRANLIRLASTHVLHMQKALDQMKRSTSPRPQRHHRVERAGDSRCDPGRGAGPGGPGPAARRTSEGFRGDHNSGADGRLPAGAPVYSEVIAGILPAATPAFDAKPDTEAKPLAPPKVRRRKIFDNEPDFDLRSHLYCILGVDLTAVPGISVLTAHTILSEIGPDPSKFRSASAFASWLPHNDISGGKILGVKNAPWEQSRGPGVAPGG